MLLNPTALSLLLFTAGLLGGGARAFVTKAQATVSARSAVDVLMGACCGVFIPRLVDAATPLWGAFNPAEQFFAVAVITYVAGDVIQNLVLSRIKAFTSVLGPAPVTPPDPPKEADPR